MNTLQITPYCFTRKAPNVAKYGENAPRDGYINTWTQEVHCDSPEEEESALSAMEEEEQQAHAEAAEYLGRTLPRTM